MAHHRQESCSPPCAAAFDRPGGDAEDARRFGHGVSLHVHEDERGALVDGELGQCGEELAVEVLALGGFLGGFMGFEELFQPLRVVHGGGLAGGGFTDTVEAGVDGDAVQPGGHRGLAAEGVGGTEGGYEGVLDGVGRFLTVSQRAQSDGPEAVAVTAYEFAEGVGITCDMCTQKVLVARIAESCVVQRCAPSPGSR
jgi:hypothetical protein